MSHKADKSFFDRKRAWSRRKDKLIEHYLPPYLAKLGTLRRPILIVDGFAGPGRFGDGEMGSPLIICKAVQERLDAKSRVPISVLCVESDELLHAELRANLREFRFARARHQTFLATVDEIEQLAASRSVLLYLDPYAVTGWDWEALTRVFRFVEHGNSVEVFLNFNATAFCRYARFVLGRPVPSESADNVDAMLNEPPGIQALDRIVGGSWWRDLADEGLDFQDEVERVVQGFRSRLGQTFKEVCRHDVKAHWAHRLPKYSLIFASRHVDALLLMNEAAVKSREMWADATAPAEPTLFENRPLEVVPDESMLDDDLIAETSAWISRRSLIGKIVRRRFGQFLWSTIRGRIEAMLRSGALVAETGKTRINDSVRVRARQ